MMSVSTAASISIHVTPTITWVKDFVEWASAEEFSENFFWVAEHEREASKDEVILELIVLVSSTVVVVVVCFIVS